MRQFFKFLTASCLGTFLALILLVGVLFLIGGSLASSLDKKVTVKPNSILDLDFTGEIPEKTNNIASMPFELTERQFIGLYDYVQMINQAAEDKHIKGIMLRPEVYTLSMAETSVLRNALEEFKQSGKFVYAYSKYMTQNAYYLSTVADSIFLNPYGLLEFRGISADVTYFKKMLDKLEIEMDIFYAGQFKSATEPFRATSMSDANRLQLREYIEDQFELMLTDIAGNRGMTTEQLRGLAEHWSGFNVDSAVTHGLIDGVRFQDEIDNVLRTKTGLEPKDDLLVVTGQDYFRSVKKLNLKARDKVALVFMEGAISPGKDEAGVITDEHYLKIFQKIEKDDRVKAVVLRVNSPGGSVLASENILHAIRNLQRGGKPVVVSMGRYAASGGYYISCYADSIFAQPGTLTGSIGVFSMMPNVGRFLDSKIGITFDTVKTTQASTYFSGVYALDEVEKRLMQDLTDNIYTEFLERVAEGRNMSVEEVEALAQGRIWTGKRAVDLGLVDRVGYVEDAIACAAGIAGVDEFRIDEYPKVKDPLQRLLQSLTGDRSDVRGHLRRELGDWYHTYEKLKTFRSLEGPQARLPFLLEEN